MERTRRHYFAAAGLLALLHSALGMYHISPPMTVTTPNGVIQGTAGTSTKGRAFSAFYGIPFAQPPVGGLRFRDPVKATPWTGVRDGSVRPNSCPQVPFFPAAAGLQLPPELLLGSEDCLYLNVFTPRTFGPQGLPVMVFIHGGAFFAGSANYYGPEVLLNHDVVLVVIQYRIGVLGFLSTEDDVIPGNYGLKDQLMALQWVQENIHLFGGDPQRVTLFGQSAGAISAHHHIMSPKSIGLFQRAILQSGTSINPISVGFRHKLVAGLLGAALGCRNDTGSEGLLSCLQAADGPIVAAAFQKFFLWFLTPLDFAPRIDGDFLPEDPNALLRDGRHQHIDIISGVTAHEGALGTKPIYSRPELIEAVQANPALLPLTVSCCLGPEDPNLLTQKIYSYYLGGVNLMDTEKSTELLSNQMFKISHDLSTQHHAKNVAPSGKTYRYELTHRGQGSVGDYYNTTVGKNWVAHSDDMFYVFKYSELAPTIPDELVHTDDLRLRDIMASMWTNFATCGDPTPDNSLGFKWEPSTADNLRYLDLNPNPRMAEDQRKEVRRFHQSLPTFQNLVLNPELVVPVAP